MSRTVSLPALCKRYDARTVVATPPLTFPSGAKVVLVGGNGSGKSTWLRMVANTLVSDTGGLVLPGLTRAYGPQTPYAFATSVERNVLIGGRDRQRAQAALDALGLTSLRRARARALSGGETAKMALARVLMRDVDLVLLDEPTAAMDLASTRAAEAFLLAYLKRTGATLFLVTHSVAQARRLADEVMVFAHGDLIDRAAPLSALKTLWGEEVVDASFQDQTPHQD